MKRWVIADTHFGHKMLVDDGHRPEGFEDKIIANWTHMVQPKDLVIHLGDVALPDTDVRVWELMARLPGRKILVMGNHDKRSVTWYMQRGFSFACESFEISKIKFTHRPSTIIPERLRFNVHGHLHAGLHHEQEPHEKHRLMSLEASNYMPVALDKIAR
jgi:calcineurin-like phosphoesterase family protein